MAMMAAPLFMSLGASAATAGTIGTVLSAVGTGVSLLSSVQGWKQGNEQANATMQAAEFQARSAEQNAGQERATAQRAAEEERRQGKLVQSQALARSAASGGASDPTVVNLIGDIAGESEYRAQTALYQGEERATGLQQGADLSRYEGYTQARSTKNNARNQVYTSFANTALSAGNSIATKYGGKFDGGGFDGSKYGGGYAKTKNLGRIDWYE